MPEKATVLRHDRPAPAEIKTVGDLIVARRRAVGIKQAELAQATGMHRQWIGRLERGRVLPDVAQWVKLAAVLKLPSEMRAVAL